MDDRVDRMLREDTTEEPRVANITNDSRDLLPRDLFNPPERLGVTVAEVVQDDHVLAAAQ